MIKTSALPPLKNIEAKNYYSESFFLDSSSIFKLTEAGCFLEPKSDHQWKFFYRWLIKS